MQRHNYRHRHDARQACNYVVRLICLPTADACGLASNYKNKKGRTLNAKHIYKKFMKKGFTLIELLVVIGIIAILASIVLVSLNDARERARDVKRVGDIRQIQLALEGYYDANDAYPGGDGSTSTCAGLADISSDLVPTHIGALPVDPGGGSVAYAYDAAATADGQDYILRSDLENTSHSALDADVDGDAVANHGCDCADSTNGFFCARP